MKSFTIAGIAKDVFPLIKLKAKREAADKAEEDFKRTVGFDTSCRHDPAWQCTCPESYCETLNCKPWREHKGRDNERNKIQSVG